MRPELILEILLVLLLAEALYQFAVSLVGLGRADTIKIVEPQKKFAIFIPAHNEEAVVGANIRGLKRLEYPKELYQVFVIADHCADGTAEVAERAGATVLRRDVGKADGKPGALNWAWNYLGQTLETFDAIVIVDADNLVSPNLLSVMNARLLAGARIIQANLDVKNPDGNWVTRAIAIAYWSTARCHQLARHKLGWCAALGGTGICIDRALLNELGWNANSLTEDLDFQVRGLAAGVTTTWAHDTRVYDEKPASLRASFRQRVRWIRGHLVVVADQAPGLVKLSITRRRWIYFDAFLYLLQPYKLAFGFITLSLWFLWSAVGNPNFSLPAAAYVTFGTLYVFHLSQYLFWGVGIIALLRERVPARYYLYYLHSVLFGMTWLLVVFTAMIRPRGSWNPTEHSAQIELAERLAPQTRSREKSDWRKTLRFVSPGRAVAFVVLAITTTVFASLLVTSYADLSSVYRSLSLEEQKSLTAKSKSKSESWIRENAISTEPGTENLLYYYYDPASQEGELPALAVTAFAALRYLDGGKVELATELGDALYRCQSPADASDLTRGAFSHALVESEGSWQPSGFHFTGENLLMIELYLALYHATGDKLYLETATGIGDWFLRVPYRGHEYGMHLEDLGAPLHCVTSDGAFENTVRPHLLLLWLGSLDQLSEVTENESYHLAKKRTLKFLEGGISEHGVVYSLYDPGYPPDGFSKAHWKWHAGDKIITDELLLSALGFYRLGKEEEARRVLHFVTQRISGGFYAYLDPKTGEPSFVDGGEEYFDVVASSLVEKLALALGEESLARSPAEFLIETQSANGGWFWGLTTVDLEPVEGKQASLINLWNGGEELPEFLVRYSRANWNSVALVDWGTP